VKHAWLVIAEVAVLAGCGWQNNPVARVGVPLQIDYVEGCG